MLKYILYYLIPRRYSYKLLYDIMSNTTGVADKNGGPWAWTTTPVSYEEYKALSRASKLSYFSEYIKASEFWSNLNFNSLINLIRAFI